jgi:hypothetical protein
MPLLPVIALEAEAFLLTLTDSAAFYHAKGKFLAVAELPAAFQERYLEIIKRQAEGIQSTNQCDPSYKLQARQVDKRAGPPAEASAEEEVKAPQPTDVGRLLTDLATVRQLKRTSSIGAIRS